MGTWSWSLALSLMGWQDQGLQVVLQGNSDNARFGQERTQDLLSDHSTAWLSFWWGLKDSNCHSGTPRCGGHLLTMSSVPSRWIHTRRGNSGSFKSEIVQIHSQKSTWAKGGPYGNNRAGVARAAPPRPVSGKLYGIYCCKRFCLGQCSGKSWKFSS